MKVTAHMNDVKWSKLSLKNDGNDQQAAPNNKNPTNLRETNPENAQKQK